MLPYSQGTGLFPSTGVTLNSLVGTVNVGGINGTNYIYTSNNGDNGTFTTVWSTPANPATAGAGVLTWVGFNGLNSFGSALAGDFDYGAGPVDSNVIKNSCGFYEYFYTAFEAPTIPAYGKPQIIGTRLPQRRQDSGTNTT
jgi:hypothetical protein